MSRPPAEVAAIISGLIENSESVTAAAGAEDEAPVPALDSPLATTTATIMATTANSVIASTPMPTAHCEPWLGCG